MGTKRILVIDDDEAMRCLLRAVLEDGNHLVSEAADGVEALALLRMSHFDLVLTDFEMPRLAGSDLIHEIRALDHALPIAIITGGMTPRVSEFLSCPVLHKPCALSELRGLVARASRANAHWFDEARSGTVRRPRAAGLEGTGASVRPAADLRTQSGRGGLLS